MVPIECETNIEVLRTQAIYLRDEIRDLKSLILRIEAELESSKQGLLPEFGDRLSRLEKKFFGFGRETLPNKTHRQVGHDEQQLLIHGERLADEESAAGASASHAESQDKSVKNSPLAKRHALSEKELIEESRSRGLGETVGSKAWSEIPGLYQESSEITVTERVYQKVVHQQVKYRLKPEYNKTGKEVIITAPGPAKLKPGSLYSIDFAVAAVTDKYEYHLPLERQRRKMEAAGLEIDVKTLYNLCETVAEHCESVREGIRQDILEEFCAAHLDESPWRILGDKQNGYMWVLSNRRGAYYQFEPTRSGKVPKEMLKGYTGAVITDAYSGYNAVRGDPKIRAAQCWSHARREFFERLNDYPAEAGFMVALIDELFAIEGRARDFETLRELRKTESPVVVERIQRFCFETLPRFLPGEGISKAIQYVLNQWKGLTLFLKDLSVPLSNNDAERALRHAVIGRKNFAGSKTINGADTAAALYTVIETAKRCSLQPAEYLRYVITERWHKREPLIPSRYAIQTLGANKRIQFPAKDEWRI